MERLNRDAIDGEAESAKFISIHDEIPSGPDAEWVLSFLKRLATSVGTMSKASRELSSGDSGM